MSRVLDYVDAITELIEDKKNKTENILARIEINHIMRVDFYNFHYFRGLQVVSIYVVVSTTLDIDQPDAEFLLVP